LAVQDDLFLLRRNGLKKLKGKNSRTGKQPDRQTAGWMFGRKN
jgi:hypothetical protein